MAEDALAKSGDFDGTAEDWHLLGLIDKEFKEMRRSVPIYNNYHQ